MKIEEAIEYQIETVKLTWLTKPQEGSAEAECDVDRAHALFGVLAELEEYSTCGYENQINEAGDVFYYVVAALLTFGYDFSQLIVPNSVTQTYKSLAGYAQKYMRGRQDYAAMITSELCGLLNLFAKGYFVEDLAKMVTDNREKLLARKATQQLMR